MPPKCDGKKENTRYGMFQIGSPLSFHLNPVGFTTNIITNIPELSMSPFTTHELPKLPLSFISEEHDVVPKNWVLTEDERAFLATIKVTEQNSYVLEQETVKQSLCELWKNSRKNQITCSHAHQVFIRKHNFESLAESLLNPNLESNLPAATRDAFRHGRIYKPVVHEKYLYATKTSDQSKKLHNLEHISKLQGGQQELEEHTLQNLPEVVSLLKVLHIE